MKTKLEETILWAGKTYYPGELVEIPDDLGEALGLKPSFQEPTPPDPKDARIAELEQQLAQIKTQAATLVEEEKPPTLPKSKSKTEPPQ